MAKIWKEPFDASRHRDFMTTSHTGGFLPGDGSGGLDHEHPLMQPHSVYFVREGDFTFQFHSLDQLRECLEYFSAQVHESTRTPGPILEHYWNLWFERLPSGLMSGQRKQRIVKALTRALERFTADEAG